MRLTGNAVVHSRNKVAQRTISRAQIEDIASVSAESVAFAYRNVVSIRLWPHKAMMDRIGTPASASQVA